ncbi:MAG: hypothetical protein QW175_05205, partial [Candidatus Bathyarchaeia archaeon]
MDDDYMYADRFATRVKGSFLRVIYLIRSNPLIFGAYSIILGIGTYFRLLVLWSYGVLQYDEAAHSVGGIFLYRIFVGGLPNVWDYLSS